MRQDDEQVNLYSRKSAAYRKHHLDAIKALYGEKQDIPVKPLTRRKVKRRIDPRGESILQMKIVSWAKSKGLTLISIPNHGKRTPWAGQKEVMMGLTRGVSDLFLTHPSNGYAGFWIELKAKDKFPTVEQFSWLHKMRELGYAAAWFDDFDIAKNAIIEYLDTTK